MANWNGMSRATAAVLAIALALPMPTAAQSLDERIGRLEPGEMREATGVHAGAGSMQFGVLLGASALSTNLLFVHSGVIAPHSGIGQHFHNKCEEMFVILDGEAEFTIDGRTSRIAGPAATPDLLGHAHAIYNPTDKPVRWLNINVGLTKAYDNFDLGDTRQGAALDPIPQFIHARFDRVLLKPVEAMNGGTGTVSYRRALEPSVFGTSWSYVDHLLIPPGASVGSAAQADMSEVLVVMSGAGEVTVDGQTSSVTMGDAVPIDLGQARAIRQTGTEPLELMVIGVARDLASKAAFAASQRPVR